MDHRAAALIIAGSALLPFAACLMENSVVCEASDQRACCCDAGVRGYETCSQDKSGYGSCACQADAGGDAGSLCMADGGLKMFMDLCESDQECETGLCFHYNAKPARCSRACTMATSAADCPMPSPGCNMMGICRSP